MYSAIDNLLKESAQHWDHFGTNTDLLFFSKVVYKIHFGSKYFGDFILIDSNTCQNVSKTFPKEPFRYIL